MEAKQAVKQAKDEARRELYENMGTREGEKNIYIVAKARQMKWHDLGEIGVIKNTDGRRLQDEEEIKNRWKEYFNTLLNVENGKGEIQEGEEWIIEIAQ